MISHAELYLHLVWSTWKRLPLLTGETRDSIYRLIIDECRRLRVEVIAIGGIEDHVHLLVRMPTTLAPAVLAKQVKGATSYLLNRSRVGAVSFRWQSGYGAFSASRNHVPAICRYVQNQAAHHHGGRIATYLEPPPEP
jgi:REP element-mobilizing transposase RayT